jgi:hypothetical protein
MMQGGELFLRRIRLVCAMTVSAAIFWYVGWWAINPYDPQGAISLLLTGENVIAMAKLLALAVVAGGLAVAICGADMPERGPLAIGVGLAALGLRGAQADQLVLFYRTSNLEPFPTWGLIAECWLWLALIAVGFVVGRWVESWYAAPARAPANQGNAEKSPAESADFRQGIGAIFVTGVVAWVALSFSLGRDADPILKGQVYFAIAASFLIGSLVAHSLLRTISRLWALVAIPLVAMAAYLVAGPSEAALNATHTMYANLKPLARPLPLEFAALGTVGILLEADAMRSLRALFGLSTTEKK